MFRFLLKMVKRSFLKDKKFFLNNVWGLTLAFTSILFIFSWINYEKSFDKFYGNSSRIYRFTVESTGGGSTRHFVRVQRNWLENFAYKIPLNWWIFAGAGIAVLGIALLSVSFQSWKAASKNPVEALRYE